MARDDFTQKTIELLAHRVGYKCSNPDCRQPTRGPQINRSKTINIGVAAHITAASEGGPRYNPSLTSADRKSPDNGIWLCWNCSKLIDNDETRYSELVLLDWKKLAEESAHKAVEQPHERTNRRAKDSSHVNNFNQFFHIENHHTHQYSQKITPKRASGRASNRGSKIKDVESKLDNSVVIPLLNAYPFARDFLLSILFLSLLSAVAKAEPTIIIGWLILLCILVFLCVAIAYRFFYTRIRLSDFYNALGVDERLKLKHTIQHRIWGSRWIAWYMFLTLEILLQTDKRTAEKMAKFLWS